jgi:membrane-bound lytic murein transglycosylase D
VKYQESRTLEKSKRVTRAFSTAGILGLAFVGGTLQGISRFEHKPAAPVALVPALVQAAAGPAWDISNTDHPRVDYFTEMFSTRQKGEFSRYLARSGEYAPMISAKLEQRGMPQDLLYLAMIESGFNPKAYSPAAASGLWQFISDTGKRYGLEINRAVDERNDPEKATDAALTYLQELHDRFGSWYLAAAAYNTGENRVARIMREETGSEKGNDNSYYQIWNRLPRETRDYVPLMIAAARISKEPARYGFDEVKIEQPLSFEEVAVAPASTLAAVAEAAGAPLDDVKHLNPQLRLARTPNDAVTKVRIPSGSSERFAANWSAVSARHTALAKAEAKKPAVKKAVKTASTKKKVVKLASARRYKVRSGDSLSTIARRHGVTVAALKRANGLSGSRLHSGASLKIPSRG